MTTMSDNNNSSTTTRRTTIIVVHCWSAPRSRSTALLYSFEARGSDRCVAIDEPLYRIWLVQKGDAVARPYRDELIQGVPPPQSESATATAAEVAQWQRELQSFPERLTAAAQHLSAKAGENENVDTPVIFCKHMAKHAFLYNFEEELQLPDVNLVHKHLLLIRDPVAVLSSWGVAGSVHGNNPTPDEVGIVPLLSIYSTLQSRPNNNNNSSSSSSSSPVVILDSDDLVKDPVQTLTMTCQALGFEFVESMMTWSPGPHACDGPWAKWWYADVHQSSGWARIPASYCENDSDNQQAKTTPHRYRTLHPDLLPALRASFPAYEFLHRLAPRYEQRRVLAAIPPPGAPGPDTVYEDPRNAHLLVYIGAPGGRGRLMPRDMARVSPWDSSVQGGDAAWEGLRVYHGKILSLDAHLRRLFKSARALGFENVHTRDEVVHAIFQTLAANRMRDGAHLRLTLTRGEKCTSSMNPQFNVYGTTLIILPEWKPVSGGATTYDNTTGISLISASQRRNSPSTVDSKIHHNNLINNILPKIQANLAGAADAIMLDVEGFVSETNATNLFLVDNGILLTPHADHCLPGITRNTVIRLAREELHIPVIERRLSLAEFHSADEVFTTGTMGGLTPVTCIDGRVIGKGVRGPVTAFLQELYQTLPDREGWATPIPEFASVEEE